MRRALVTILFAVFLAPGIHAQEQITVIDSIAVSGHDRVARETIVATAGIPTGQPIDFQAAQRAMEALYATGQFDDVRIFQGRIGDKEILEIVVSERPILSNWSVQGASKVPERRVRGRIRMLPGLPLDPVQAARSRASIDSLYKDEGFYQTRVTMRNVGLEDGSVQVIFDIDEGRHVTISQVVIDGNEQFSDEDVVGAMKTSPEGFWWFQSGSLEEEELERDIRERIPHYYASKGFIDFHVTKDSLDVNEATGKATLILQVSEGERYKIGSFAVVGNRFFSTEQIESQYPFPGSSGGTASGGGRGDTQVFDQARWDDATRNVQTMYMNNGYIYAQIANPAQRRTAENGDRVVDLRWQIVERTPAIINKIVIRGNTITHDDVVRRQIVMIPGDVMRQAALIRSYQNVSNLGFFEQPMSIPRVEPANDQGDVDVIFDVEERHTGNINFGATVGQGTGLGGFIGLTEPNMFGRAKHVQVQWQFGRNINDVNVSYTDPALRGTMISGTVSAHSSRLRYTIADLGRIQTKGIGLQLGFPVLGSRYTRLVTSYAFEQSNFDSPSLQSRFTCDDCVYSAVSVQLVRDTRIDLPFPSGGLVHRFTLSQAGGPFGGSGNFRRATFEGKWYATLKGFGGDPMNSSLKLVIGLGAQAGWVWGDVGPHFRQLFSMGGTQFGIPLRGYDEFSITPNGFDVTASGSRASSVNAFAESYFATTAEIGLRISQSIYVDWFVDAGNVWARSAQFNPTKLFRATGIGLSLITPLGPIGLDYAYGFDRVDGLGRPAPKWKFHFRLGNFF